MIDAINTFFDTFWKTLVAAVVASVCVGCLVELYKQSLFTKLENKYKDNPDKLAKVKTIKAGTAFGLASLLVAFFLACIWKSDLPKIGNVALLPIWYTAMFLLQLIVDVKAVKTIFGRILGNIIKATEPKEARPKLKKEKVVSYVYRDGDGNIVNPENA